MLKLHTPNLILDTLSWSVHSKPYCLSLTPQMKKVEALCGTDSEKEWTPPAHTWTMPKRISYSANHTIPKSLVTQFTFHLILFSLFRTFNLLLRNCCFVKSKECFSETSKKIKKFWKILKISLEILKILWKYCCSNWMVEQQMWKFSKIQKNSGKFRKIQKNS